MKGIQNKITISQKIFIIYIYGLHHYKGKLSKFSFEYITFSIYFNVGFLAYVYAWVPCHHGMARPQVADGGNSLQFWRVAANILNEQSRTEDKRWWVGCGANNSSP
jgi:hypothetical protein